MELTLDVLREYAGRDLTEREIMIFQNYKIEKTVNTMMRNLHKMCKIKGTVYVPVLTSLDGNCLMESFVYHGLGADVASMRRMLSIIMYIYRDYKNFFPNNDNTLQELFNQTNEVEIVELDGKKFKYDYTAMCQDLSNDNSWTRLPTELILMVVSYIFKLNIIIINDNNTYETNICITSMPRKTIYLGHIGEAHYVPITNYTQQLQNELYYNKFHDLFLDIIKKMKSQVIQ